MKIVICGGHLSPALSLLEVMPKHVEVIFIGRKYVFEKEKVLSLEYKVVKEKNIPFYPLTTGRFQRKFTLETIPSLLKFPIGFFQSITILRKEKPNVVVGVGGYISLPVCLAALLLGIPVVIHEQTQEAGFANKLISHFARKVCISWESSRKFFPEKKIVLTGNPIRKEFRITNYELRIPTNGLPTIYVTGGETGSHFINNLISEALDVLLLAYNVIHQAGESEKFKDYEQLARQKKELDKEQSPRYVLQKFISPEDVGVIIKNSDLVIARAGINTVTELAFLGKPSLLIPIPFAQRDEQKKNAAFLKNSGIAEILEQKDATPQKLMELVEYMFKNIENYKAHSSSSKKLVNPAAAELLKEVVLDASKKEN